MEGEIRQACAEVAALQQAAAQARAREQEAKHELARCKASLDAAMHAVTEAETELAETYSQQPVGLDAAGSGGGDAAVQMAELTNAHTAAETRAGEAERLLAAAERGLGELEARWEAARGQGVQVGAGWLVGVRRWCPG